MKYYAKSKAKILNNTEKQRVTESYQRLLEEADTYFSSEEKRVITNAINEIITKPQEEQVLLINHLKETRNAAEEFFRYYGDYFTERQKELVLLVCANHDIGKADRHFQDMVTSNKRRKSVIPHGMLSCLLYREEEFLSMYPDLSKEDFKIYLTAICYHHTRVYEGENNEIKSYCEENYVDNLYEFMKDYQPGFSNRLFYGYHRKLLFHDSVKDNNFLISNQNWNEYLIVKGMLNRCDWSVSAGFQNIEIDPKEKTKPLVKEIEEQIKNQFKGSFRPAQKYMKEHSSENLVIVAPTGSGKTEAALLWLNGEKGFYTLPLQVSSNAIYKRIKECYQFDNVALVHSNSMQTYIMEQAKQNADGETTEGGYRNYERAKLLSNPLTVCTVDQLFKFVYKALGTEIFAATLKYSKIIIDEIQSYEPRVVAALICGLKTIVELGGEFAIITATFPPVLKHFMEKSGLLEGKDYQFQDFSVTTSSNRHMISVIEDDFDIEEIIVQGQKKKVLVLCNTVKKAQELYEILKEQGGVFLLHSRFIRKHRNQLENNIIHFSQDNESTGIWISTQIVEASLDIDFDVLYTEMCPCDSLLQRMGRCNRAGRLEPLEANVKVYVNYNGVGDKSVYDKNLYENSVKHLKKYEGNLFTEEWKAQYVNEVYAFDEIQNSNYYKKIEFYIEQISSIKPLEYEKKQADKDFRSTVKSITILPDKVKEKYEDLINAGLTFLKQPSIGNEAKTIVKSKLEELTVNINSWGEFPNGVDIEADKYLGMHRASLKYEFDEQTGIGAGLWLDKEEEDGQFL